MFREYDIWLMIVGASILTMYSVKLTKPQSKGEIIIVIVSMYLLNIFLIGAGLGLLRLFSNMGLKIGN